MQDLPPYQYVGQEADGTFCLVTRFSGKLLVYGSEASAKKDIRKAERRLSKLLKTVVTLIAVEPPSCD
jgi:ethanolamine utilization microcompartment shell protein EutS